MSDILAYKNLNIETINNIFMLGTEDLILILERQLENSKKDRWNPKMK
jgi:hypothetical protein